MNSKPNSVRYWNSFVKVLLVRVGNPKIINIENNHNGLAVQEACVSSTLLQYLEEECFTDVLIPKAGATERPERLLTSLRQILWLLGWSDLKPLGMWIQTGSVRLAWTKALQKSIEYVCHPNVRDKMRNYPTALQATTWAQVSGSPSSRSPKTQ